MKRIFFFPLICLMATSCTLVADPSKPYSLEFARDAVDKKDCSATVEAPPGGSLFSVWTKVPNMSPHDYDYSTDPPDSTRNWIHGNVTVYVLKGTNWYVWALVGNVRRNPDGYVYNANTMLFIGDRGTYAGDYSYYQMAEADEVPFSTVSGWVWVAWQIVVNADKSMVLEDAQPQAFVSPPESPFSSALPPGTPHLSLLDPRAEGMDIDDAPLEASGDPEQLAYILFTSGSTGRPKGVEIPRGALANFLRSASAVIGVNASDRIAALSTTTFDMSELDFFLPLYAGATVVVADHGYRVSALDAQEASARSIEGSAPAQARL